MEKVVAYIRCNPKEYILTQENVLEDYAKTNNIKISKTYIDNGFLPNDYNRNSLKNMLTDIITNKIDTVLVTELKVIGKDASKTIYYINYFKEHNIRFIAINDKFDNKNIDDAYYCFNEIVEALNGKNTNN